MRQMTHAVGCLRSHNWCTGCNKQQTATKKNYTQRRVAGSFTNEGTLNGRQRPFVAFAG